MKRPRKIANPYRLQRVTPVEVPKKEAPRPLHTPAFVAGDIVSCRYRPLFFDIHTPSPALEVEIDHRYVSGWKVLVETTDGQRYFDSDYFTKLPPP